MAGDIWNVGLHDHTTQAVTGVEKLAAIDIERNSDPWSDGLSHRNGGHDVRAEELESVPGYEAVWTAFEGNLEGHGSRAGAAGEGGAQ